MDIWGPYSTKSVHRHQFFLTILDDKSQYLWVVPLRTKYDVRIQIQNFVQYVEMLNVFEVIMEWSL